MKKVCILGTAETLKDAPFNDTSMEFWALNDMYLKLPNGVRINRWFELHVRELIQDTMKHELEWLKTCNIPVYMIQEHNDIPTSVKYPIDEIESKFRRYFKSTVDYMIALAIFEGFEEIHIYGVNMAAHDELYSHQKASGSYWIGRAEGMGVKVVLPESCDLLKGYFRYGFDEKEQTDFIKKGNYKIEQYKQQSAEFQKNYYLAQGALNAWESMLKETRSEE